MFTLTIETENDAFGDNTDKELARVLREIADQVSRGGPSGMTIRDANGNTVGRWEFSKD